MRLNITLILFLLFSHPFIKAQDCFEADASIWENTWNSCSISTNPNSVYGNTHWIMYDLGEIRNMSNTWIWNCNDPDQLDRGFELIEIDYSLDGSNWTNWGQFNCPQAEGRAIYPGFKGPDLQGVKCQFILITVISNYGDPDCAGIAEIKFNLLPGFEESLVSSDELIISENEALKVLPNPASEILYINGDIRSDQEAKIIDSYGRIVHSSRINKNKNYIDLQKINDGIYYLKIGNKLSKFMKIN